ncbi:hypothetical protein SAM23877_4890 [Streptomyces ambofaciens ATCC 23877]|uniref:Uncharacterized protein n=1 Tax=Streptomyces ambofaciens (strain ATCC 23877 / 3486 / DSM 40053 / JCM 4204 / NBRC 12836 / NRRL B-2516) TaxID=278992 RepID=A0A0K2AXS7_STRA7|nr:hypothetical protein SAM23877_4890 [Streptomyces ambofaciens ATCC 23877]
MGATDQVTHLVCVTPRMGLLLMTPRVHRQEGAHVCLPTPLTEVQTPPGARESSAVPTARDPLTRALRG